MTDSFKSFWEDEQGTKVFPPCPCVPAPQRGQTPAPALVRLPPVLTRQAKEGREAPQSSAPVWASAEAPPGPCPGFQKNHLSFWHVEMPWEQHLDQWTFPVISAATISPLSSFFNCYSKNTKNLQLEEIICFLTATTMWHFLQWWGGKSPTKQANHPSLWKALVCLQLNPHNLRRDGREPLSSKKRMSCKMPVFKDTTQN